MIINENYHSFQRFRLLDIGKANPSLFAVTIADTSQWTCKQDCDAAAIKKEYSINGVYQPKEAEYAYKYLIDVDGNSFSGRFLGLLKSGSLVFKVHLILSFILRTLTYYDINSRLYSLSITLDGYYPTNTTSPSSQTSPISSRKSNGQKLTMMKPALSKNVGRLWRSGC